MISTIKNVYTIHTNNLVNVSLVSTPPWEARDDYRHAKKLGGLSEEAQRDFEDLKLGCNAHIFRCFDCCKAVAFVPVLFLFDLLEWWHFYPHDRTFPRHFDLTWPAENARKVMLGSWDAIGRSGGAKSKDEQQSTTALRQYASETLFFVRLGWVCPGMSTFGITVSSPNSILTSFCPQHWPLWRAAFSCPRIWISTQGKLGHWGAWVSSSECVSEIPAGSCNGWHAKKCEEMRCEETWYILVDD